MSYLRIKTAKKVPLRSFELHSLWDSKSYKDALKDYSFCCPNLEEINSIFKLPEAVTDSLTDREGPIGLNDNGRIAVLCWMMKKSASKKKFLKFLTKENWKEICGEIRDQMFHILCWAYVASDLVSAKKRLLHKKKFVPLSVWHICAYCDSDLLGNDPRAKKNHHCYGCTNENGMLYIQSEGGHKEIAKDFDCMNHKPPLSQVLRINKGEITNIRRINTLEEALEELKKQPVGADLIYYSGMFDIKGDLIYYGPKFPTSGFVGYHSVIIVGVTEMEGEVVAICKLSNGFEVGKDGYLYVSLGTVYFPVGVDHDNRSFVRNSLEPMHLLSDFVVVDMCEKEDRTEDENEDTEEDETKGEADKDKADDDQTKEDTYVPIAKRSRPSGPSRPTRRMYF